MIKLSVGILVGYLEVGKEVVLGEYKVVKINKFLYEIEDIEYKNGYLLTKEQLVEKLVEYYKENKLEDFILEDIKFLSKV